MNGDYILKNQVVDICSKTGVKSYCRDYNINVSDFDMPVEIDEGIKDCSQMFSGCSKFNQMVKIPEKAENCMGMFMGCKKFNQDIIIPDSVKYCGYMFFGCLSLSYPADKPEGSKFHMMHFNCPKRIIKKKFIAAEKIEIVSEKIIPVGEIRMISARLEPASCSQKVEFYIEDYFTSTIFQQTNIQVKPQHSNLLLHLKSTRTALTLQALWKQIRLCLMARLQELHST